LRYQVRYRTFYQYRNPVPFAQHLVRVLPAIAPGQQVEQCSLEFVPAPIERYEDRDFFGNRVVWVVFDRPHATLETRLEARVIVRREAHGGDLSESPHWEVVRDAAARVERLQPDSPVHFLFASPKVSIFEAALHYARRSFTMNRPILEAALDLAQRIHQDFEYRPGSTNARTDAAAAFAEKRGVCQDFAHVMIAGLRALGLPAAYVSGFIQTLPAPGRSRLEGADAMHAWVRIWCGETLGWVGIDPTNTMMVGDAHVEVATGRDYSDVSPIDGIVVAAGSQSVAVGADVIALP
jgi:transglutaminase-like putative cysteine protease